MPSLAIASAGVGKRVATGGCAPVAIERRPEGCSTPVQWGGLVYLRWVRYRLRRGLAAMDRGCAGPLLQRLRLPTHLLDPARSPRADQECRRHFSDHPPLLRNRTA